MSDKKPTVKIQSTAMPDGPELRTSSNPKKERKLTLDDKAQRPAKTRTELYKELAKDEDVKNDEDYYELPHPIVRGIGLGIDAAFTFALVKFSLLSSPFGVTLLHSLFLDKYKLEFMFGDNALLLLMKVVSVFLALFLFVVVPVAFFNVSLGKKITQQRVRGDGRYTLNLSQAFQRELIYKPLSIACLVGFILPFFDKKKKSLHDKLAGTFVVKE